eukprot:TRINITY_DN13296_c0_g1_i2.p1 TRINITY_DN13296_c0_g1~~TRINITY_DN13296_c0_g1_i2.p1  ORF type:complete len:242 (-),score=16.93 TRINITY_DN13296_c0_g1_i2:176-901(-)
MAAPHFEDTVVLGCADVALGGSAVLASVCSRTVVEEGDIKLPSLDATPAALLSSEHGHIPSCGCKTVNTHSGSKVTLVTLNARTPTPTKVAHELVQLRQSASSVRRVILIGATPTQGLEDGQIYQSTSDADRFAELLQHTSAELPGRTAINDALVGALWYWLLASGIPSLLCCVKGYKMGSMNGVRMQKQDTSFSVDTSLESLCAFVRQSLDINVTSDALKAVRFADQHSSSILSDTLMYT